MMYLLHLLKIEFGVDLVIAGQVESCVKHVGRHSSHIFSKAAAEIRVRHVGHQHSGSNLGLQQRVGVLERRPLNLRGVTRTQVVVGHQKRFTRRQRRLPRNLRIVSSEP